MKKRNLRFGAAAGVTMVLAAALFLLSNLVCYVLDRRMDLDIDMTSQKMYSLAPEAKEFLKALEKDVSITILQEEEKFDSRTQEALRNYAAASSHIDCQYVNVELNPSFAGRFPGAKLTDSSIIVSCGKRFQILEERELYYLNEASGYTAVQGIKIDQKLCSAIAEVISEAQRTACVIAGHGEVLPEELRAVCETANRPVREVNLLAEEIDAGADVVILCEPSSDFDAAEIKKLEDFLDRGSVNLLVFADAQVGELPVLQGFLAERGILLRDSIVADPDYYWGGSETYILASCSEEGKIGQTVREAGGQIIMPLAREVSLSEDVLGRYEVFPLLSSHDTAYVKDLSDGLNTLEKRPEDREGPFLLGAVSVTELARNNAVVESAIFVFGSAAMASDAFLTSAAFGNREIIFEALLYGKQQTALMSIRPIYIRDMSLNMTAGQVAFWRTVLIGLVPICICAVGTAVWYRRKKR